VDAFNCGLRVSVGERREGHFVDLLVTFPVDRAQNPVLSCNRHHRPARTVDYRRVDEILNRPGILDAGIMGLLSIRFSRQRGPTILTRGFRVLPARRPSFVRPGG
jgi:hypothetical protein